MLDATRALFLSPHTDDVELGCGGTLARYVEGGGSATVVALSPAVESLPPGAPDDLLVGEFRASMATFGLEGDQVRALDLPVRRFDEHRQAILEHLVALRRELAPDLVVVPAGADVHQDHRVVHDEAVRAFRGATILGYELPWNQLAFATQVFVRLEDRHVDRKCEALRCYASQVELGRPYFAEETTRGLARVRGVACGSSWAEAFEAIRVVT